MLWKKLIIKIINIKKKIFEIFLFILTTIFGFFSTKKNIIIAVRKGIEAKLWLNISIKKRLGKTPGVIKEKIKRFKLKYCLLIFINLKVIKTFN